MIEIHTFVDDSNLIHGLDTLDEQLPGAIQDGLGEIVERIHVAAIKHLQGPKRGLKTVKAKKSGRQRAVPQNPELAGGYPVPRVTGNLLRLLGHVKPGRSRSGNGLNFNAAPLEAILYNAALYASYISEGEGSSEKYGKRPFTQDALKEILPDMEVIMNGKINRLINGLGL